MGENHFAPLPCALYGVVLLMAAVAYYLLQRCLISVEGRDSVLRRAVGADWKGKSSPLIYMAAIGLSFAASWVALGLYVLVAGLWLVPDRRIERVINDADD